MYIVSLFRLHSGIIRPGKALWRIKFLWQIEINSRHAFCVMPEKLTFLCVGVHVCACVGLCVVPWATPHMELQHATKEKLKLLLQIAPEYVM